MRLRAVLGATSAILLTIMALVGVAPAPPAGAATKTLTFSATPTTDLVTGQTVSVSGRTTGAVGRTVRIAQMAYNGAYSSWVGPAATATVRADGTFSGSIEVTDRAVNGTADCTRPNVYDCRVTAWVMSGSSPDATFSRPGLTLDFRAKPGSGLRLAATSPAVALVDGNAVTVRVTGARPGQTIALAQCMTPSPCYAPNATTAVANAQGVATGRVTVRKVAYGTKRTATATPTPYGCRGRGCFIIAGAGRDGLGNLLAPAPLDPQWHHPSIGLAFTGQSVVFTATPTTNLRGGQVVSFSGTFDGGAGFQVRIAQMRIAADETTYTKVGSSVYRTIGADDRFSGTFTLPANPDCRAGQAGAQCVLTAWVVGRNGAIDKGFGTPDVGLTFAR